MGSSLNMLAPREAEVSDASLPKKHIGSCVSATVFLLKSVIIYVCQLPTVKLNTLLLLSTL